MLLRQIDENSYFDDLSAKTYTIDEIIVQQQRIDSTKGHVLRDTYFIIEELVDNFVKEYKIPYDYKVFCLHGIPKLILQVDRNVYHNTMTFFDGNFIPLKEGIDWFINNDMAQQCIPVIPPSASQILTLSRKMAMDADEKLVRIDWFDTGEKAVFGEFTFCSGGFYTGMQSLSDEILEEFEKSFDTQRFNDYSTKGYHVNTKKLLEAMEEYDLDFKSIVYDELLKKCAMGNHEAIVNMADYFHNLSLNENNRTKKQLYEHFMLCWQEINYLHDDTTLERLCKQVRAKKAFITSESKYYNNRVFEAKNALKQLSTKSDWYKIRWAQFVLDFGGTDKEVKKSRDYVNTLAADGLQYAVDVKRIYGL